LGVARRCNTPVFLNTRTRVNPSATSTQPGVNRER
jgi:hypothetical protein